MTSPFRRLARVIRPSPRAEIEEELAFHFEQRVRDYVARGLGEAEATSAARARLGQLDPVRAECAQLLTSERRTEARREWVKLSWLDFRLGLRMLVKYPVLTVVGGLSMAFAIWAGVGTFEFVRQVVHPVLPLEDGDRVVGVVQVDAQRSGLERRISSDFLEWKQQVRTIDQLGAWRTVPRNLIGPDGAGEPVQVAEMSAVGFDVARVPPLMGRTLLPADEQPGAPPVVVIGHDIWQDRYAGDPAIVGRTVRLGTTVATVVGVMPEGFAFPGAHSIWMPLRAAALAREPREGPGIFVLGRLAPGSSLREAQAELATLGRSAAVRHPDTHEHLRPRVLPYAKSFLYLPTLAVAGLFSINLSVLLLLALICGNVALLMFARAATRESEILVRSALGASRGRIVAQLFVEALVLGALSAALGLAAASFGLEWLLTTVIAEVVSERLPFWMSSSLSPATIGYTLLLALLAAAVAGVLPALKVTKHGLGSRLREAGPGGGGLRFSGVWTVVIVLQVAVTVVAPVFALMVHEEAKQVRELEVGFAAEDYIAVRLDLDRDDGAPAAGVLAELTGAEPVNAPRDGFDKRYRAALAEFERRLEARRDVAGVTFAERLPRMYHPHRLVEVDAGGAAPKRPEWPAYRVSSVAVTPDYFAVLGVPVRTGRGFHPGDVQEGAHTVIVNESFVRLVLGGRNPIGRRIQYSYTEERGDVARKEAPWFEIVGVVPDLGLSYGDFDPKKAGIYHAVAAGGAYPTHAAIRVTGDQRTVLRELRTLAAQVDPALRLDGIMPLDRVDESELRFYSFWQWILVLVCGVALTLSLAGIYAIMAFAVSRRTREIGIRVALGAGRGRIIAATFARPLLQVGAGVLLGGLLLTALAWVSGGGRISADIILIIAACALGTAAACLLACIVPTRRALTVEPMEALRAD